MRLTKLTIGIAAVSLSLALPGLAAEPAVRNTSYVEAGGGRVLQLTIDIDAPPAKVWKGFVDEATLRAWQTPLVHVDLRAGGDIEEGFDPKGKLGGGQTIHHRILAVLPERLLILRNISTPPGTPGAEVYPQIVQIVSLDALPGDRTRVTLAGAGYGAGPAFDQLYSFFATHNPEFLVDLKTLSERKPGVAK